MIGGEASSLRVHAGRQFGSFGGGFQAAVAIRHPDIQPTRRAVATEGTPLNSQAEVVAYNAMRIALPNVRIDVHVTLPGKHARSPRSGDFALDGQIWVEVLGLSQDEMTTATSWRQTKYATQWENKLARYNALSIIPVVIEPADTYDPHKLAQKITEIARQLGVEQPPTPPQTTRTLRAKGTWTFDALSQAVGKVAGSAGTMPTQAALIAAGYGHAAQRLRQPGERQRVLAALGPRDKHRKGVWTRARVVEELAHLLRMHGTVPTRAELRRAGHGAARLTGSEKAIAPAYGPPWKRMRVHRSRRVARQTAASPRRRNSRLR